jgi:hypothetical protein
MPLWPVPTYAELMGDRDLIYVELLNEGVSGWRPVDCEPLGDGRYRLLTPPDYDPETETWAFMPGSVVRREERQLSGGTFFVAIADGS